jgi:signal transduction histidine kinase
MSSEKSDLYTTIIFISIAFFVIVTGIIFLVTLYYQRKKLYDKEKKLMSQKFEAELLKTHLEVQEQTMQTIAADLHDNIGQLLSLTSLTLGSIDIGEEEKAKKKIDNSLTLLNKSIKELRELAKLMNGEQIIATGLGNAIKQEVDWLERTGAYRLKINNQLFDLQKTDPQKDLIILRLLQELINNIIKHAQATTIEIDAYLINDHLHLIVKENGVGFDYETIKKQQAGIGLSSVHKRVKMMNGKIYIDSGRNLGTLISIEIPYP